ncbi:unnamed protein product [Cladocopium goreaui]|uniref:Serine/threonine protein kinase OSK4 (OsK4) n=1 Tax=Cladocopium goreaui TaxID=2562237 RepID=A0A9P1DB64_9DINO|nr:unnamed protein product [Cladocopium goreaui]
MGSGGSVAVAEQVNKCSTEDLQQILPHLSDDSRVKLLEVLGSEKNVEKKTVIEEEVVPAGGVSPATILTSFWRKKLGQEGSTSIPIVKAADLGVISRSAKKFEGKGGHDPWFGPTAFTVFGERWTLDDFLGAGAFGQSYLATHEPTGHRYVMKFLSRDNDRELKFLKEAPFQVFQHPNVITYVGIATHIGRGCESWNPARHIVVMEAIPNGELFDLITAEGQAMTDGTMRRLVHGIINGMAELCKYGITHRDLKPDNLLIDENGQVIIIDLGCANLVQWLHEGGVQSEDVGSPVRMSVYPLVDPPVEPEHRAPGARTTASAPRASRRATYTTRRRFAPYPPQDPASVAPRTPSEHSAPEEEDQPSPEEVEEVEVEVEPEDAQSSEEAPLALPEGEDFEAEGAAVTAPQPILPATPKTPTVLRGSIGSQCPLREIVKFNRQLQEEHRQFLLQSPQSQRLQA